MPASFPRGTAGSSLATQRHDGETAVQRRHTLPSAPVGATTAEDARDNEAADPERNSMDEADQNSGTENRNADNDQLAQDLAQMLDIGVRADFLLLNEALAMQLHVSEVHIQMFALLKTQLIDCMQSIISWAQQSILPFLILLLGNLFLQHFYTFIQLSLLMISAASSTLHLQAVVAAPLEHKLVKSRDVLILVNLNIWALSLLGIPDNQTWQIIFLQVSQASLTVRRSLRIICAWVLMRHSPNLLP